MLENPISTIISVISSIGAINWGLVAIFDFNLVTYLFDNYAFLSQIIYSIIGLSGILSIILIIIQSFNRL